MPRTPRERITARPAGYPPSTKTGLPVANIRRVTGAALGTSPASAHDIQKRASQSACETRNTETCDLPADEREDFSRRPRTRRSRDRRGGRTLRASVGATQARRRSPPRSEEHTSELQS